MSHPLRARVFAPLFALGICNISQVALAQTAAPTKAARPNVARDALRQGWEAPPDSTKPHVYWYWLNNIVTKTGIADVSRLVKPSANTLRVLVTNNWANRMIGDERFPDDLATIRAENGNLTTWPDWAFNGVARPEPRRITLSARRFFKKDSALQASGLLGPLTLQFERDVKVKAISVK